jgi:signal transduction histidine kinase
MASAMLLIGMVMLKVSQRNLVQAKIDHVLLLKVALERILNTATDLSGGRLKPLQHSPLLAGLQTEAQEIIGVWQFTVADGNGRVVYVSAASGTEEKTVLPELIQVMRSGMERVSFSPTPGPLSWVLPERIVLDAPLIRGTKVIGAVRLAAPLVDVRQSLGRSRKLILFYIMLDVLVLVAFGTYVFSKLVVRPVQQLVQTAEGFQEGDRLPDVSGDEKNELGKLAQALNAMLQRLAENKKELQQHITSLEQANLELQRAQQEVIFGEKLASVGRLAAGIAHEIGNPIGIVLGYLELLQREDIGEDERLDLIGRMGNEIQRINQIIRQLLDLSRPSSGEREIVAVNPLIQEILEILDPQFRRQQIDVFHDLSAQADTVFANADQLKQVFLNLMVNATDAMAATDERPQGGQLRVLTRTLTSKDLAEEGLAGQPLRRQTDPVAADYRHLRWTRAAADSRWIEILFADTGAGITEADQEKIFDPFFTTKEVGKGTGLGLSVSIQIVETLGGRMEVDSRSGEGTSVSIFLPNIEEREEDQDDTGKQRRLHRAWHMTR